MNDRDALDMFAAAALSALISPMRNIDVDINDDYAEAAARLSYQLAEFMARERKIEHDKLDRKIG